jgi:uncharacterized protein YbjT (DUF2867 family)
MSCITVLGGTGFLGRRVVRHLQETGAALRIASRHPGRAEGDGVERIAADVHDERAVEAAVAFGARGSGRPGRERGTPGRRHAAGAPVRNRRRRDLVLALYSQPRRRRGGRAGRVPGRCHHPPAVMFAPDDGFLTTILGLLRLLPAYPMFGDGRTKLQPVYADDVAAAITSPAAERNAGSYLRTGWPAHLFVR